MTIEPRGERGTQPLPEKPFMPHHALDIALMTDVQYGVDVLEHTRMRDGDAQVCEGALEIVRLNYEAEVLNWKAGTSGLHKLPGQRLPKLPSRDVVAENLELGGIAKVAGLRVINSLDLNRNITIAALMNAARLIEGRAVTSSAPVRAAKLIGGRAWEMAGGEVPVSQGEMYLQRVANAIIADSFDEERNIGPWAAPFLWARAIRQLKKLQESLPKDEQGRDHPGPSHLAVPLGVGLEQSLAHTKNWLGYPAKIQAMATMVADTRNTARHAELPPRLSREIEERYHTPAARDVAIEHARLDIQRRLLRDAFIGKKSHIPLQRKRSW